MGLILDSMVIAAERLRQTAYQMLEAIGRRPTLGDAISVVAGKPRKAVRMDSYDSWRYFVTDLSDPAFAWRT